MANLNQEENFEQLKKKTLSLGSGTRVEQPCPSTSSTRSGRFHLARHGQHCVDARRDHDRNGRASALATMTCSHHLTVRVYLARTVFLFSHVRELDGVAAISSEKKEAGP